MYYQYLPYSAWATVKQGIIASCKNSGRVKGTMPGLKIFRPSPVQKAVILPSIVSKLSLTCYREADSRVPHVDNGGHMIIYDNPDGLAAAISLPDYRRTASVKYLPHQYPIVNEKSRSGWIGLQATSRRVNNGSILKSKGFRRRNPAKMPLTRTEWAGDYIITTAISTHNIRHKDNSLPDRKLYRQRSGSTMMISRMV